MPFAFVAVLSLLVVVPVGAGAQPPGKWPPDSLVNTQVFPKGTPVAQVVGTMRGFALGLDVRCQFCHVGQEGQPLPQFDFASDEKREKRIAREMMRMVADINRRLDSLPQRDPSPIRVTCASCHRGMSRPAALTGLESDLLALLDSNHTFAPRPGAMHAIRGNMHLLLRDTAAAIAAFRRALQHDSTNVEARGWLRALGQRP